jgi:hypothetical protein
MNREGELVGNERGADTELDCVEIDAEVARLEADLEHAADQRRTLPATT